jgi:hypothetical protein
MGIQDERAHAQHRPYPALPASSILTDLYALRHLYRVRGIPKFDGPNIQPDHGLQCPEGVGTRFEIPFFLFQGETDVITLTSLAEEYFVEVDAPVKQIALIKNADHSAPFTQSDQFLTQLLTRTRPLAS